LLLTPVILHSIFEISIQNKGQGNPLSDDISDTTAFQFCPSAHKTCFIEIDVGLRIRKAHCLNTTQTAHFFRPGMVPQRQRLRGQQVVTERFL
jgi:hypothetical protein